MLKFVLPVILAFIASTVPAQAGHACKCHHVHKLAHKKAHKPVHKKRWIAARQTKGVKLASVKKIRKVTTTTTVTRTVHYSPPQVIERAVYVDRPIYVERPVYYERRVPVYRTRTIIARPRPVVYRRAHYWRNY